jgi:hypothetical protein
MTADRPPVARDLPADTEKEGGSAQDSPSTSDPKTQGDIEKVEGPWLPLN